MALIREAASRPLTAPRRVATGALLALVALGAGAVVGAAVWALLRLAYALVDLVWNGPAPLCGAWFFPLVVCTVGGLAIGLWSKRFHADPKPLFQVMADVKRDGGYRMDNVGAAGVAFVLPIAFGASVGPEAGLTGFVAAGCTWVGRTLKRVALRAVGADPSADPSAYEFAHGPKVALYTLGVAGGMAALVGLAMSFGIGMGLPRLGAMSFDAFDLVWLVPLALCGWLLALLMQASQRLFGALARRLGEHPVLKPVLCGVALGAVGVVLPDVMFSGGPQVGAIAAQWGTLTAASMLLTGVVKAAATPACIEMGWHGGPFFPIIFAGVSFGFGFGALVGADPVFCAAVVSAALLGRFMGKPVGALALTAICCPVASLPGAAVGAFVGAKLPMPACLRDPQKQEQRETSGRAPQA